MLNGARMIATAPIDRTLSESRALVSQYEHHIGKTRTTKLEKSARLSASGVGVPRLPLTPIERRLVSNGVKIEETRYTP